MLQTLKNIVNSRIAHIIMHFFAWTLFFFFPFIFYRVKILDPAFYIKQIINVAFLAGFFYLNIFYLIPSLLSSKKFLKYLLAILCCIFVIVIQQFLVEYLFDTRSIEQLQIISLQHENNDSASRETISHHPQISHVKLFIVPEIIRQALTCLSVHPVVERINKDSAGMVQG